MIRKCVFLPPAMVVVMTQANHHHLRYIPRMKLEQIWISCEDPSISTKLSIVRVTMVICSEIQLRKTLNERQVEFY